MSQPARSKNLAQQLPVIGSCMIAAGVFILSLSFLIKLGDLGRVVFMGVGMFDALMGAAILIFREKIVTFLNKRRGS